jgi:hypothetical protein
VAKEGRLSNAGGYEMLAAILRPKMKNMVDVACTRIILSMLGINMDNPE